MSATTTAAMRTTDKSPLTNRSRSPRAAIPATPAQAADADDGVATGPDIQVRLALRVQDGSLVIEATVYAEAAGPERAIDWAAMTDRVEATGGWLIRVEVNGEVRMRAGFPVTG